MSENQEKAKTGRPRVELTEKQINDVKLLSQYLNQEQLADYLGISRVTFNAIMKRDPRVSLHYKEGRANAILAVSQTLLKKAQGGNIPAMIFYLKTQAGWKETTVVDNTSSDGTMSPKPAVQQFDMENMSDKDLKDLQRILANNKPIEPDDDDDYDDDHGGYDD